MATYSALRFTSMVGDDQMVAGFHIPDIYRMGGVCTGGRRRHSDRAVHRKLSVGESGDDEPGQESKIRIKSNAPGEVLFKLIKQGAGH